MRERIARTTCPYCGVGCGIHATRREGEAVAIAGDPEHPANFGRLCAKGMALPETLGLAGRLLHPWWRGERIGWDRALDLAAAGLAETRRIHGPDAVAFYVSGQLLTEDYYVANKLLKGFIGTANIDTNSRLCMASSVAGHRRAFGADVVPASYADLDAADLVVLIGANTAWCHPVLFHRLERAKAQRPGLRLVVIDPRRTATAEAADLHLPLRSGSDATLFAGLLVHLADTGASDSAFIEQHTSGAEEALAQARVAAPSPAIAAERCGLDAGAVRRFYEWFAATPRVMSLYSQGINQSSSGTDKVNAIINCHLLTGRIGREGSGPLSLTGQPNAMGGREVGGLSNQLAAHLDIDNEAHRDLVRRFWQSPTIAARAGLKAVDMFDRVAAGDIKAIWIMATNPAVSMPEADRVRRALECCPLVILSDCMADTDTARCADLLLPALGWGEKDGTVTNSERRISRQRAFLDPPGEARADWWIITQVARRLGFAQAFPYETPAEIFREHALLSGFENGGTRAFDIGALEAIDEAAYDALAPVQWPLPRGCAQGTPRLFGDGRFYTADRRARFVAVAPRPPVESPSPAFPLVLNTGRLRDQWHTMTRSGRAASLSAHEPEPFLAIHPEDAAALGLDHDALARVESGHGAAVLRIRYAAGQPRGTVFAPMHWSAVFASHGRIGPLVNAFSDPISGQPELKHTPVHLARAKPAWQAFLAARQRVDAAALEGALWAMAATPYGYRYELAGDAIPGRWEVWARRLFPERPHADDWLSYEDPGTGIFRYARLIGDRLDACVFIARERPAVARDWLVRLFGEASLRSYHLRLLAGEPAADDAADHGRVLCTCLGVGENTVAMAIHQQRLRSVDAIGAATGAGTNCGSCRGELAALLRATAAVSRSA